MPLFSEPERLLLEQWTDARLLEESMKTIRSKYKSLLDQVLEQVMKRHSALDYVKKYVVPDCGMIAIGKDSWPKGGYSWPSGFYIEQIQLESLCSPELEPPYKTVWVWQADSKAAEGRLRKAAERILSRKELRGWEVYSDRDGAGLWCRIEAREALFKLLVDGESRGFVECLVTHFGSMTRFTSVVDDMLKKGK